jgi:tetratricopeptide (TPR) repeat protein
VTILATSRERLRLPGERVCAVPALSLTDGDAPAVRLFVERAQAVRPGFRPDEREAAVIREIVGRLDGLPLAIELAAARLLTLDVSEIAAALDDRFALLSTGYRTSARHGSLAATVSWSFGLLDEGLKQTFLDLSTFAGAFSVTDASAVCGLGVGQVTVALDQLVERSLVMRAPGQRYILLETLRAFAAEEAAARPAAPAGERHARHFIDWMETADRRLVEPQTVPVIAEIDAALPELRNALGWSLAHDELGLAGRLVRSLMHYGFLRLRPDVLAWSARVTAADPHDRGPLAPVVWAARAYAAWMAGDTQQAELHARHGRALSERAGGPMSPRVATIFGNGELFQGRLDEATRWYRKGIADAADDPTHRQLAEATAVLARAYAGDSEAVAMADRVVAAVGADVTPLAAYGWFCAGEADLAAGDHRRAQERFRRALQLAEQTNASFVTGAAGASAASIEARHGDPAAAAADYVQLMTYWRRAGMWPTQWTMLRAIAGLLARLGQPQDAAVLEGAVRATAAGHRIFGTDEVLLGRLGEQLRVELGADRYEDARRRGAGLDGDGAVEYALGALRGGA